MAAVTAAAAETVITPGLGPSEVSHRRSNIIIVIVTVIVIPLIIFNGILFIDTFIFVLLCTVKHGGETNHHRKHQEQGTLHSQLEIGSIYFY